MTVGPLVQLDMEIQLIKPTGATSEESYGKLLVYLPGTDGTGQAILPQIPALHGLGYDVWCLYMPPDDRSDWEQLTTQLTLLLRQLLTHWQAAATAARQVATPRITIVAESFGCCLALRLVASGAGPELLDRLVLVNPATSFNDSLSGLSSLIAATNLLSLFPRDWYAVAQNTLLPLLVDGERVDEANQRLLQSMILMEPPPSNQSFGFGAARPPYPAKGPLASAAQTALNGGAATAASAASDGSGALYYAPAAAANFRANLLRSGDPGEEVLRKVEMPVLLITSARDRLLPSIVEGARLERVLPNARRCILPDSGHAALLERGINLAATMQAAGFADDVVLAPVQPTSGAGATVGTSAVAAGPRRSKLRAEAPVAGAAPEPKAASAAPPVATSINASSARESLSIASDTSHPSEAALAAAVPSGALVSASGSVSSELPMRTGQERTAAASNDTAPDGDQKGSSGRRGGSRRSTIAEGGGSKVAANEEHPAAADVDSAFDEWCQKLAPWRDVVSPVVLGFEHLPPPGSPAFSRPMLFVGNHQKMGFYDTPLLVYELYVRGYRVRGLAHPGHWAGPFGRWFESFGSVKASPMAAFRLLRASEKVLLFPGGAKEVVKKRGQEYKLLWKESPDFVRLAARCNALIVPFAAVGADDAYDVIMDTDEVIAHPVLGPLTTGLLSRVSNALDPVESIFPITRMPVVGLPTPIPIPNLQRLYFQFAPPVDPRALGTNINDPQQVQELYDNVKGTVTQCMAELLAFRDADEESQVSTTEVFRPRASVAFSWTQPTLPCHGYQKSLESPCEIGAKGPDPRCMAL
ncbi:hypothetical protein VOLCADRAFT_107348 [Volvox carteri f. nagariensis]|uniref:Phospholipid/glycerol acyltransferase domain-containing protein n=1 Tax=Volvox carteri f. nagariensis TaxID=3068 RepID=D8UDF2_VOLCA|nr:uncharacterized protein VOLCADRAFT_107348 [Volvox carteri f. nagariensis]EFJ42301.1 hypothetical protein VOLCADRAFT_107348 [Volvox carteri f. nagariensis]|eukprot:XP_002956699.1 hypothetical protein VOLCADRAFT_107348 [Volvox carteri f. nagariensis]